MLLAKHLSQLAFTTHITQNLGQRANYVQWLIDTFSKKPDLALSREKVWDKLISGVARDRPVVVWEFGVAWGYSTDWWLKRLPQKDLNWHGFDRFIGLPRDWRNYRAGDLSAGVYLRPSMILECAGTWATSKSRCQRWIFVGTQ
jgi:hypothetical protein